ncbi:MAG: hypothetical protein ACRD3E_11030 [Terriglobales bacterium]
MHTIKVGFVWFIVWLVQAVVIFLLGQFRGRNLEKAASAKAKGLMQSAEAAAEKKASDIIGYGKQKGSAVVECVTVLGAVLTLSLVAVGRSAIADFGMWTFYIVGQALHAILQASIIVGKNGNPTINTYRDYFRKRGLVLGVRFFAGTCVFMFLIGGGAIPDDGASRIVSAALAAGDALRRAAIAGVFGLGIDALLDKLMAKIGLERALSLGD